MILPLTSLMFHAMDSAMVILICQLQAIKVLIHIFGTQEIPHKILLIFHMEYTMLWLPIQQAVQVVNISM